MNWGRNNGASSRRPYGMIGKSFKTALLLGGLMIVREAIAQQERASQEKPKNTRTRRPKRVITGEAIK